MADWGRPDRDNPEHVAWASSSPLAWGWFVTGGMYCPVRHVQLWNRAILDSIATVADLLLEAPPRHGKSMLVSRFLPGWFIGRQPWLSVLHASWKVQASEKWGRRIRSDLAAHGSRVFGIELDPERKSAGNFGVKGAEGGFLATGATGGVQGEPANLLVTDDMVKGIEVVRSEVQLPNLAEFCTVDLETRREPGCVHVSIETPWHEMDPHGVWRDTFPNRYRTIRLPAKAEADDPLGRELGEPLWPERFGEERLTEIQEAKPWAWQALYQCRPTAEEGGVWKRAWWRDPDRVYDLETRNGEQWIVAWDGYAAPLTNCVRFVVVDLATTESETRKADATVVGTFALTNERPRRLAILEMDARRVEAPEISPMVKSAMQRWGARVAYYETRGNQKWGAQYAKRDGIPARSIGSAEKCDVRISGDKVAVAHDATPLVAGGRLLVAKHAPWVAEWEHEMLTFPNAAHDDREDVTAWACHIAAIFDRFSLLTPRAGSALDDDPQKRRDVNEDRARDRWAEEWENRQRQKRSEKRGRLRPSRWDSGTVLEEGPVPP